MVQSSLQRDPKQVIVCCPLPWAFDFLINNISVWITGAHNKLTMFKLARHLLRTQTNPIPLVSTMECCSWIFSLKCVWYVRLLTPVKQRRSLLRSGDLHRKTLNFVSYRFLCAKFVYLGGNGYLYDALHFEPHIHIPVERPALIFRKKKWGKAETFTVVVTSRYMWG